MIEFIIPLNLPVRAVAVTETAANPPGWVLLEMTRWAAQQRVSVPAAQDVAPPPQPEPSPLDLELESLRGQRAVLNEAVEELKRTTKVVEKRFEGVIREFGLATVELAHAIAAKLIFEAVDSNRFPIESLVHEVISRLDTNAATVVRLHPDDLAYIQQSPVIGNPESEQSVQFIADATLSRGDCKAKAGDNSVVYELKRQIDEIRRQLLSTVNGHAEA